jgi:CheY-like chemotaxis protein
MGRKGMIVIVDDDVDDIYLFNQAIQDLGIANDVRSFQYAEECYEFLCEQKEEILVIFSDIEMPRMNGLEFKRKINSNTILKEKKIPFIFHSTLASHDIIREAFDIQADGFFVKNPVYSELKKLVATIVNYWTITNTRAKL